VPLAFGGAHASAPVARAHVVWWTEGGYVYAAREHGHAHRVARGTAAGVGAYLDRGVLHVGRRRIALPRASEARWGGGRVLWSRYRPDGAIEVFVGRRRMSVVGGHRPYVRLGQIDAHHAVWTEGRASLHEVIEDGHGIGKRDYRRPRFAASVAPDGTLYFGESGFGCGSNVRVLRRRRGRTTVVATLPRGTDLETTWYADGALYAETFDCKLRWSELEKVAVR
jgi:hypothetical protein